MLSAKFILLLSFSKLDYYTPNRALAAQMTDLQFPEPPASGVLGQDHNQLPCRQTQLMYRRGNGGGNCLGDLC